MHGNSYSSMDNAWKLPIYIRKDSLPPKTDAYTVGVALEAVVGKFQVDTIQLIRSVYRIYLYGDGSNEKACEKGISINNIHVDVYASNPFLPGSQIKDKDGVSIPLVRLLIKDLYKSVSNTNLLKMLKEKFGITITGEMRYSFVRNHRRELTHMKTGDRFCFVSQDQLKVPLPREAMCGRFKVRLFHDGQFLGKRVCYKCFSPDHAGYQCSKPPCCRVCKNPGHEPGSPDCTFYERLDDILPFGGEDDPFSNHFPCKFKYDDIDYHSSQQAYSYKKCMANGDTKLANSILDAPNAKKVMELAKQLRCTPDWDKQPYAKDIMHDICLKKFTDVEQCNRAMHKAHIDGLRLVEAVPKGQWSIWSSGLTKEATKNTRRDGWQGDDQMGDILMSVMSELFDEWDSPRRPGPRSYTPPPPAMDINSDILDYTTSEDTQEEGEIISDYVENDPEPEAASAKSGPGSISKPLSDKSSVQSVRPSGSHLSRTPTRGGGGRGGRTGRVNAGSNRSKSPKIATLKRHYTSPLESANKTVRTETKLVLKEPTLKHDSKIS